MRDRHHRHDQTIGAAFDGYHDHARAIFPPFILSGLMFMVPQIRIGDDEAELWVGKRHALLGIHQGIEMIVFR